MLVFIKNITPFKNKFLQILLLNDIIKGKYSISSVFIRITHLYLCYVLEVLNEVGFYVILLILFNCHTLGTIELCNYESLVVK